MELMLPYPWPLRERQVYNWEGVACGRQSREKHHLDFQEENAHIRNCKEARAREGLAGADSACVDKGEVRTGAQPGLPEAWRMCVTPAAADCVGACRARWLFAPRESLPVKEPFS